MELRNLIDQIKEQRRIEAISKDIRKKLTLVATMLGDEIVDYQEDWCFTADGLECGIGASQQSEDLRNLEEPTDEMPTIPYHHEANRQGYQFDGLRFGCNYQILSMNEPSLVKMTVDGRVVYLEDGASLVIYQPQAEWEARVDHWYKMAIPLAQKRQSIIKIEEQRSHETMMDRVKSYLKEFWGASFDDPK